MMSEPTTEELRQACEAESARCTRPDDCGIWSHSIARALLSRLDREAEAERRIDLLLEANGKLGNQVLGLSEEVNARGELLKVAREAIERKIILGAHCDWDEGYNAGISEALAEIAPAAPEGEKPKP